MSSTLHEEYKLTKFRWKLILNVFFFFRAWLNEILAKITASELPKDVAGAETLMNRHKEYKMEMDTRMDSIDKFSVTGNSLIAQGHFMSEEIADRISTLENKKKTVLECWEARREIYQQNLDLRVCKLFFIKGILFNVFIKFY